MYESRSSWLHLLHFIRPLESPRVFGNGALILEDTVLTTALIVHTMDLSKEDVLCVCSTNQPENDYFDFIEPMQVVRVCINNKFLEGDMNADIAIAWVSFFTHNLRIYQGC